VTRHQQLTAYRRERQRRLPRLAAAWHLARSRMSYNITKKSVPTKAEKENPGRTAAPLDLLWLVVVPRQQAEKRRATPSSFFSVLCLA